jgi:acylphosphatase
MKVRVHVFVSGRVQGVFFRAETERKARQHAVKGWVRNLPDDRVEAVFEGEEESVRKLLEFSRQGPSQARVTHLEVKFERYTGEFKDFEARC